MKKFIKNFELFREFLNSPNTEFILKTLTKDKDNQVLKLIRERFNALNLNASLE